VLRAHGLKVAHQLRLRDRRQHRDSILVALPTADHDLVAGEVHVLDPQATALEHPEARPVEQAGHEPRHAVQLLKQGADLGAGQDDGQPCGALGAYDAIEPREVHLQHVAVQEQQRAQGLVLGRGRDVAIDSQRGQEPRDLRGAHLGGVALVVEEDIALDPPDIGVFGSVAVVAGLDGATDPVEEPRLGRRGPGARKQSSHLIRDRTISHRL
jgi:hypothetical protein